MGVVLHHRCFVVPLVMVFLLSFESQFAHAQHSDTRHLELPLHSMSDQIIRHLAYTLCYNEQHEQATWVAYELTRSETQKAVERSNKFMIDPLVKTQSATNLDYKDSGYDRGHLAPAADMGWSTESMKESFYYSNMSPQLPAFNRGIWKQLEEKVRDWAIAEDTLLVVTGPVLRDGLPAIGINSVSIPEYYYKVLLDFTGKSHKGIGFILPNRAGSSPLQSYAVSIDSVEKVTGIDFFYALVDKQENELEHALCLPCWEWNATNTRQGASERKTPSKPEQSPHKVNSNKAAVQCSGKTKSGTRCKRSTSSASGKCYQHE